MAATCKYCSTPLPASHNPRREFCNDAHKQAYWRRHPQGPKRDELAQEVKALSQLVQEHTIQIARLRAETVIRGVEIEQPEAEKPWWRLLITTLIGV